MCLNGGSWVWGGGRGDKQLLVKAGGCYNAVQ
jgi:hypothetical protein